MPQTQDLKKTSLHETHVAASGRMVPFAGWDMPVQYSSILTEARAVRSRAGLFDVSHMGRLNIEGSGAATLLNSIYSSDIDAFGRRRLAIVGELLNAIRAQNLPFGSSDVTGTPYLQLGSELNDGDYDDDSDDGAVRREFNDAPFGNIYPTNQYNFKRSVEMKRLSNDPNDYRFEMVAIKVSLYWNEGRHDKEVTLWGYTKRSGS